MRTLIFTATLALLLTGAARVCSAQEPEELNEQLRPENIEGLQVMGSLRPEEVRESTRRRLTNQQSRIQTQLQLLQQSRNRIHSSISVTDMLIQNLRMQMQAAARP